MSAASVARRPRTTTGQNIGTSPVKETVKFVCLLEPKGILEPQNWRGAYHALQGDLNKIEVEFTKKKLDGEHRSGLVTWTIGRNSSCLRQTSPSSRLTAQTFDPSGSS
ncbi:uncharacterized protein FOBCDRAFT_274184 [Fusarium oxysporum Fo47]|uniref:Uncharacterized protein n=1 Tax=Fusarium oxysporum Fo47 TaxID=660027 RepID=W9JZQ9_FUSOX|nr:uncharacterized protein FOBCDRAFT_274184 [Fusarium oxysporum Fo47]EWZ37541.1 hypothetical protein FOZG_09530 [Fusarium oxysporum Fo47]QKD54529.1 hypothetical protein FOBCDRAFT_274184 [Fusarium oxysporum Fo47]